MSFLSIVMLTMVFPDAYLSFETSKSVYDCRNVRCCCVLICVSVLWMSYVTAVPTRLQEISASLPYRSRASAVGVRLGRTKPSPTLSDDASNLIPSGATKIFASSLFYMQPDQPLTDHALPPAAVPPSSSASFPQTPGAWSLPSVFPPPMPNISELGDIVRDASRVTAQQTTMLDTLLQHPFVRNPSITSSISSLRCKSFDRFHTENPEYFPATARKVEAMKRLTASPTSSNSYSSILKQRLQDAREAGVEGSAQRETVSAGTTGKTLFLDEAVCGNYLIEGDLQVCGDLRVRGKLTVVTGFNSTAIFGSEPAHVQRRCILRDLFVDQDVNFPFSNLWVVGGVHVGGSIVSGELVVDAGSSVTVGARGIKEALMVQDFESGGGKLDMESLGVSLDELTVYREVVIKRWYTGIGLFDELGSTMSDFVRHGVQTSNSTALPVVVDVKCLLMDAGGVPIQHPTAGKEGAGQQFRRRQRREEADAADEAVAHIDGGDATVGDVLSGRVSVHNGGSIVIYGNIRAEHGVLLDGASEMHSLCGQLYTNTTGGMGIAAVDGSVGAFNGVGDSRVFQVTMQDSGILSFGGNVLVPAVVQADESSVLSTVGSLFCSAIAVDDQSQVLVGGDLDCTQLIEAIDYGGITVGGDIITEALQIFDGGQVKASGRVAAVKFLTADGNAQLIVTGSGRNSENKRENNDEETYNGISMLLDFGVYANETLHISDNSEVVVLGENAAVRVEGTVKVVASKLLVLDGGVQAQRNFVVGKRSTISVARDITALGFMKTTDGTGDGVMGGEEGGNDGDTLLLEAQPSFYCESSDVIIGGKLSTQFTWTELNKRCNVEVNDGVTTREGLLVVDGGSTLSVRDGGLIVDKGLSMERNSKIIVNGGEMKVREIGLADHSFLAVVGGNLEAMGDAVFEGRSEVVVGQAALFRGNMLYVDEASRLSAAAVGTTVGDIFVEDRALVQSRTGDIISGHSVVCQDRGKVISAKNILARKGDIVAENNGQITAYRDLSAPHGRLRKTREANILFRSTSNSLPISVFVQDVPAVFLPNVTQPVVTDRPTGAVDMDPFSKFKFGKKWAADSSHGFSTSRPPPAVAVSAVS
eukprot:GHVQ01010458.1.p1 GENE.GHVQ01010458.1~~GHVQ01010458.1.p1  ORF type:complete len:1099 (+),score=181.05 GHVQ01010458.1:161-3457(+)